MRTNLKRTLVALVMLSCTAPIAPAEDLGFWERDRRMAREQQDQAAEPGMRQVTYFSEIGSNVEQLPSGTVPMTEEGPMPEPYYEPATGYGQDCCPGGPCCQSNAACCQPSMGMYYAEAQLMFLRAHVLENSLGKLSEKYEFSPRFTFGYESASGFGARTRYWTYGRTTPSLEATGSDLDLDFDVYDFEGTARFCTERADLVLASGFRWVNADIDVDDQEATSDMPGITLAGDGRIWLCRGCRSQWSALGGARWSILGADWEGDGNALVQPTRDDNIVVQEIYGGFEYLRHYDIYNLYVRLIFEVQNWQSDALAETGDTESLGFLGPGIHAGATF